MIKRTGFYLLFSCGSLFGAPQRDNLAIQEMRLALEHTNYQIHSHQVEIDLFQERLDRLEASIEKLGRQFQQGGQNRSLDGRLSNLEKAHETLIADFKSLKGHLNETNAAIASCQTKLSQIDKQLSSDVKGLKNSLESMLTLLQTEAGTAASGSYVVKPGDSLGQIAIDHKTDITTLKQLNKLSTDMIFVGQKLILPH